MKIVIRKAQMAQLKPLLDIFTEANRYKIDRSDRSWAPGFSEKGVIWMIGLDTTYAAYLTDKSNDASSNKQGDEIVGTVALDWEDAEGWGKLETGQAGYIHRLAVKDGFHGQHLGQQIIDWAANQVKRKGCTHLRLDCSVANQQLCAYYEKLGFKRALVKEFPGHDTAALYERVV